MVSLSQVSLSSGQLKLRSGLVKQEQKPREQALRASCFGRTRYVAGLGSQWSHSLHPSFLCFLPSTCILSSSTLKLNPTETIQCHPSHYRQWP